MSPRPHNDRQPRSHTRSARAGEHAAGVDAHLRISDETLRAVERGAGDVATRSVARMDEQLGWFRTLPANQRSWVTLVAQAGITGYLRWMKNPGSHPRIADEVFGTAPRDLIRTVSLRRTVELVRVAITVAEQHLPAFATNPDEQAALRDSLLRYSREIAFAAAAVYATAAETRGAWDARVEAALVDGLVRGEDPQSLSSRAATLDWDPVGPSRALVGVAPTGDHHHTIATVAEWALAVNRAAIAAVHGSMLVMVLAGDESPPENVTELFATGTATGTTPTATGTVVAGPVDHALAGATRSARQALSAFRVVAAWPDAPPLVRADDLLAERALAGDADAVMALRTRVFAPLAVATSPLLESLDAYVAHGGALEPAARGLFTHPNTMRYRLHKVAEITGRDPWNPRDRFALRVALVLGRLDPPDPAAPDRPDSGQTHRSI